MTDLRGSRGTQIQARDFLRRVFTSFTKSVSSTGQSLSKKGYKSYLLGSS
jgi:hypothetical protein